MQRGSLVAAALAAAFLLGACGGGTGEELSGNLFANPGFEQGRLPSCGPDQRACWFSLKPPDFILSDQQAHTGSHSAFLQMRDPVEAQATNKYHLVQEIAPQDFPDVLSGHYRVDNWKKGTQKQYLQFVVMAFEPDNLPSDFSHYQIRYILAGINEEPFEVANVKFVFISKDEPKLGEWIPFQRNIREDFELLWGTVPQGFSKIRVVFEVRYDDKQSGDGAPEADVYYDDLYIGPARAG